MMADVDRRAIARLLAAPPLDRETLEQVERQVIRRRPADVAPEPPAPTKA